VLAGLWQEETERLRAENRELCALAAGASNANANVQELRQALESVSPTDRRQQAQGRGCATADAQCRSDNR
jgi:hypothetical protein